MHRRSMLLSLGLLPVSGLGHAGAVDWYNGVKVGSTLPAYDAEFLNEPLGDGARITLVDFWATWCAPCRDEIPKLNRLYAQYRDKGLLIVGLTQEKPEIAAPFLKKVPMDYPSGAGGRQPLQKTMGIKALPYSILVDRANKIVWRGQPSELDSTSIEAWLQRTA